MEDRRSSTFTQKISLIVVAIAGWGGLYVLADPVFTLSWWGQTVKLGGDGFSEQLKGAVVQTLLIGGWTTVLAYWIGASASGSKQQESISRIAEQVAPASSAAQTTQIQTDTVSVAANTANVTGETKP